MKQDIQVFIEKLHSSIVSVVEELESKAKFKEDEWKMANGKGGGLTKVMENGETFDKVGANFSAVYGTFSEKLAHKLNTIPSDFFATGVSVVIHPKNPFVPTVHCNFRYLEQYDREKNVIDAWFGGGADLTPYYPYLEDIQHFHQVLKNVCDKYNMAYYPKFKKWCDDYFFLPHRNETRGAGGIFFDYLKENMIKHFSFLKSTGRAFIDAYFPIVKKRKNSSYTSDQKQFQLYRRGRYVEFNLLFDRGTLFGIETKARTESILMSLPNEVKWMYNYHPSEGSADCDIYKCLKPRDWLSENKI